MRKIRSVELLALSDIGKEVNYKSYLKRHKNVQTFEEDFDKIGHKELYSKENRFLNRELGLHKVNMKGGK